MPRYTLCPYYIDENNTSISCEDVCRSFDSMDRKWKWMDMYSVRGSEDEMTREEAKANQDRIAKDYDLGYWYGTNCEKCCDVFPKFRTFGDLGGHSKCYYECEVCGKRTETFDMPWQAAESWNRHEWVSVQMRWF